MTKHFQQLRRTGFTLIELMISISLVLLLLIGVSKVFSLTTDTIGANQSVSGIVKTARSAQATFQSDFNGFSATPFIIIRSERTAAFGSRKEMLADRDAVLPNPAQADIMSVDLDGNNAENDPGEAGRNALYSSRNHRIDRLLFFSSGFFRRQTGNDGTYVSTTTSKEAFIRYQLCRQPNAAGAIVAGTNDPGGGTYITNPNNIFGNQWVLGRVSNILLLNPPGTEQYIMRTESAGSASPLSTGSQSQDGTTVQTNRYDMFQTSISDYLRVLTIYTGVAWWDANTIDGPMDTYPAPAKPITAAGVARNSPMFVQGCSQFIVEFAGDFVRQNNDPVDNVAGGTHTAGPPLQDTRGVYGDVQDTCLSNTTAYSDGVDTQVDFFVTTEPVTGLLRRHIRWYGLPRDVNSVTAQLFGRPDGVIESWTAARSTNQIPDVVPLRDILLTANNLASPPASFVPVTGTFAPGNTPASTTIMCERGTMGGSVRLTSNAPTYTAASGNYATATNGMLADARYTVAWGPDAVNVAGVALPRPSMIRITMTLEDPTGRLPDGQTFQYVFNVKQ